MLEILGIVIVVLLILILLRAVTTVKEKEMKSVEVKPGECPHTSSKKMKVTSMGDQEDYYLCKLCNEKVKASELRYFEKGGI